ncbi:MAG: HAD-IC family P-type ATPase [Clostridiales bacterium]|nr:HAD-IC family P-type ATPase [Clostridiales bacterium]
MKKKTNIPMTTTTRADRAKRRLLNAAVKPYETVLIQYDNDFDGYDEEKVDDMRGQYGANVITRQQDVSVLQRLREAFVNPFTIVLLVLAALSFITDVIAAAPGEQDPTAVVIVLVMVMISGLLRFVQELRSGNAAEKLSEMVETTIAVARLYTVDEEEGEASEKREIPLDEVVVGDVIHLAAGDIIPADLRILQAKDLFVSQSSLTGESEPVEKTGEALEGKPTNPLDLPNLAFMGSTVISGSATALALAVGDDTVFGVIAGQLQEKTPPTSFEIGVGKVSWLLIRFMLVMVPVVLFVNGFTKGDWLQAFLFAVSVAVGLTPEMLPMIVSANLAKGAASMAKKKVIVKEINAIQNFGAMDILCTDKTGTLTQDKIILEYHLDVHGNSDVRVLRHAFLNSYYQTGLKNLMDISIIERAKEENVISNESAYAKVDEILLGADVEGMDEGELRSAVEETVVFAKLSPQQKARIVAALRENGHTVGYMGDGINDAAAMRAADVGISVDTAVDIAKESAKMILTEKDLMVLHNGVIEGRKIYANIIKYIKMTASSNFGNMFSVLVASAFLPFLPMLPIHILLLNLIYDISCIAIPWDNVDEEFLAIPRKWDASSIGKFMAWIGPTSSVFDVTTYALMYFLICPALCGGLMFHQISDPAVQTYFIALFQAGWFVESMWSQTLVIHMIRTPKIPFLQSRASLPVVLLTFTGIGVLTGIPFTAFGAVIGLAPLPPIYFAWLGATVALYMVLVTLVKLVFVHRYSELL